MNLYYKKSDYHNYISFIVQEVSGIERKMLVCNDIEGILPCQIHSLENEVEVDYEIDGKMNFCEFLEGRMIGKKELNYFYESLLKTISNMRAYLIPVHRLFLNPEAIFIDRLGETIYFCCIPSYEQDIMEQIKMITELLLKHTDHKDQEGVFFIYGLYQMLQQSNMTVAMIEQYIEDNGKNNCMKSMTKEDDSEFKKSLDIKSISLGTWEKPERIKKSEQMRQMDYDCNREKNTIAQVYYKDNHNENAVNKTNTENKNKIQKEYDKKKEILHKITQVGILVLCLLFIGFTFRFYQIHNRKNFFVGVGISVCSIVYFIDRERIYQKRRKEISEKKEDVRNRRKQYDKQELEGEKTILLYHNGIEGTRKQSIPYLKPLSSEEDDIIIGHTPLVLGSLQNAVDIVIHGRGVSRIHATIECESDTYYIRDLNSTNGTEWNGEILSAQVPQELKDGDIIMIGAYKYQFMH